MLLDSVDELRNPNPGLNPDLLPLRVDGEHLVHEGQVHHPPALQPDPVGRQPRPDGADLTPVLVGVDDDGLELRQRLRLEEDAGLDLVVPLQLETVWRSSAREA